MEFFFFFSESWISLPSWSFAVAVYLSLLPTLHFINMCIYLHATFFNSTFLLIAAKDSIFSLKFL